MASRIRKSMTIIILLAVSILLLSACAKKDAAPAPASSSNSQRPQRAFNQNPPDLYGEVKAIAGNDITIALLEQPQQPQRNQVTDEERQKMRENRQNNGQGGPGSGQNNTQGPGNMPQLEKKYTGENQTITVSSDTSITTFGRGNGTSQNNALKVSDIKPGSIIQVYYNKDSGDKKQVQSIRVINMQNQSNN